MYDITKTLMHQGDKQCIKSKVVKKTKNNISKNEGMDEHDDYDDWYDNYIYFGMYYPSEGNRYYFDGLPIDRNYQSLNKYEHFYEVEEGKVIDIVEIRRQRVPYPGWCSCCDGLDFMMY